MGTVNLQYPSPTTMRKCVLEYGGHAAMVFHNGVPASVQPSFQQEVSQAITDALLH